MVSNIRNYAVHTVPEHAFALILALRRNLIAYREDVARGLWQKSEQFCLSSHPIRDLHGATLGIFGEGSLGQGVASLGRAFGMRVLFADHAPPKAAGVEFTPGDKVLASCFGQHAQRARGDVLEGKIDYAAPRDLHVRKQ